MRAEEVRKQRMDQDKNHLRCLRNNVEGVMMKEDRYYVQRLTEQVFLIRERLSANGAPGPDDRIVRSFDIRHDAHAYADSVNEKQRKLDEVKTAGSSALSEKE